MIVSQSKCYAEVCEKLGPEYHDYERLVIKYGLGKLLKFGESL